MRALTVPQGLIDFEEGMRQRYEPTVVEVKRIKAKQEREEILCRLQELIGFFSERKAEVEKAMVRAKTLER